MRPSIIAHADWGSSPGKRWLAIAELDNSSNYRIDAPVTVGEPGTLIKSLRARSIKGSLVVGFDFPIGLPKEYCWLAGISDFPSALINFGKGKWKDFYTIAREPSEISLHRPFFPYAPGGKSQAQLTMGLGVPSMQSLLRACERRTNYRPDASPLFWTLGAKQVGRAAIIGWNQVLTPALQEKSFSVGLWPFQGSLGTLLSQKEVVIVETYPAEACVQLGLGAPGTIWSKSSQDGRKSKSAHLKKWASRHQVILTSKLIDQLDKGFGSSEGGDDKFDAVVGLFGIIEVVIGRRAPGDPDTESVRQLEGWILGQV